jgi:hypothetical protein
VGVGGLILFTFIEAPMTTNTSKAKIRWAPRLQPMLLKRLYDSDARGERNIELCDDVGITLYMRCRTYAMCVEHKVDCPLCRHVVTVSRTGITRCGGPGCNWETNQDEFTESVVNHYAFPGRAMGPFLHYYHHYPDARTYQEKMLLIDQLIHSFHQDEKAGNAVKSVASKLLEGNKKAVVAFLDALSALNPEDKDKWREVVATTIDKRFVTAPRVKR